MRLPAPARRGCALVGEHNREVLAELGYSAAGIEALHATGVVGDRYGDTEGLAGDG